MTVPHITVADRTLYGDHAETIVRARDGMAGTWQARADAWDADEWARERNGRPTLVMLGWAVLAGIALWIAALRWLPALLEAIGRAAEVTQPW